MPPRQQCIWLRKSKTWATSPGSRERTLGCPPSPNRSPPRRSGWPRASAGYAVTKGNRTRATTRWPEFRQEFSPFLLKRAPSGESYTKGEGSVCETHQPSCRLRATGLPLPTYACRRRFLPVHECRGLRANEDDGNVGLRLHLLADLQAVAARSIKTQQQEIGPLECTWYGVFTMSSC
jgi:hypothetical protein